MPELQSEIDDKTIELLNLIDKYETLVNNDYRTNFIDGFVNLSKANYEHLGRGFETRYGIDSIDLRDRVACLEVDENFCLVDLTGKNKEVDYEEKSKQGESGLKNRKRKEEKINKIEEVSEDVFKDPILQFGGMVPNQLRQSQNFFKKAIENSVQVVKLQRKIKTLILEIENLKS
ncbi:hypothetical protein JA1_003799 [Spathaspora sp. JA1]|nr:hypothetical protein JA1_003799 [Spathaspora sp. JA1]